MYFCKIPFTGCKTCGVPSLSVHFHSFIIGGGIAGTVLALQLNENEIPSLLIDAETGNQCSQVAAGLMNPITGKRQTLSWKADEFFPYAVDFYKRFEKALSSTFFSPLPIHRILSSDTETNNWSTRMHEDRFKNFLTPESLTETNTTLFSTHHPTLVVHGGGRLDIPTFIHNAKKFLKHKGLYLNVDRRATFKPASIYGFDEHTADNIFFADGWHHDVIWDFLPFTPMKGEILTVKIEGLPQDRIVVGGCFVAPSGNDTFRVGATYDWRNINTEPTQAAREQIEKKLTSFLKLPYQIVDHQAGIRPAVKDRRPMIGRHPKISNMFLFNGLGSKGSSIAPLLATWFIDSLKDKAIPVEIDLNRFS